MNSPLSRPPSIGAFTRDSRAQLLAQLEGVEEQTCLAQPSPDPLAASLGETRCLKPDSPAPLRLSAQQARWVKEHMELARRLSYTVSEGLLSRQELQSVGYQALVNVALRYDPNHPRGASYATFASYRVRGAMIDAARRLNPGRGRRNRVADPDAGPAFLSERLPDCDTRSQERLVDPRLPAPDQVLLWSERRQRLSVLLQALGPSDQELLHALYDQERSMSAVGRETGVSTATISRRHARVIAHLRKQAMRLETGPAPRSAPSPNRP